MKHSVSWRLSSVSLRLLLFFVSFHLMKKFPVLSHFMKIKSDSVSSHWKKISFCPDSDPGQNWTRMRNSDSCDQSKLTQLWEFTRLNYFNNILIKKWIYKFQNFADVFILFIFWKSNELYLCINYHKLNIIIIKNHYFLSLTNKLLDWLSSLIIFSKINLQNIYHKICIY